jgi:hypothetical protein
LANGGPKLRCFCNRRPSDGNSGSMPLRVSLLNFAENKGREKPQKNQWEAEDLRPASHLLSDVSLSNRPVRKPARSPITGQFTVRGMCRSEIDDNPCYQQQSGKGRASEEVAVIAANQIGWTQRNRGRP